MSNRGMNTRVIDIKYEVFKYVLGRNKENIKTLQEKYPSLSIYTRTHNNKYSIVVEGSALGKIDTCARDIDKYVMNAYSYYQHVLQRKRVNREKMAKKRAIQSENRRKNNNESSSDGVNGESSQLSGEEGRRRYNESQMEQAIRNNLKLNYYAVLMPEED